MESALIYAGSVMKFKGITLNSVGIALKSIDDQTKSHALPDLRAADQIMQTNTIFEQLCRRIACPQELPFSRPTA
ncbi:hypothetical protein Dd1591_1310 [Dickeya chrysanthemi Ech1591]|uniref:Uncharacterized protein n=1 Tax=Dickeya chrysanthemi (strain Ech1591) TaxID=561229 RepID=C6CQI0_DICC1|nr:hypothetical protein Dd1591_1310 [Dickeya chrysanthemi Ech1591]